MEKEYTIIYQNGIGPTFQCAQSAIRYVNKLNERGIYATIIIDEYE